MPGFDRTGPRGEGPLTGGRRGLCVPQGYRPAGYYGAGRGGRPWGGGRGFAWGGGRGYGRGYVAPWLPPGPAVDYPQPVDVAPANATELLGGIRDRLSELAEMVGALYGRFEAGRQSAKSDTEEA